MLFSSNAITINTMMREARSVGAAKILCMWQESSVKLSPFVGEAVWLGNTNMKYFIQLLVLDQFPG